MLTRPKLYASAMALGLIALAISAGLALANHVQIGMSSDGAIVAPANPETLRAESIQAKQVRANTIYANKIEADDVQGMVHQTRGVKIGDTEGKIRAPEVTAAVIYAEEIHANSVIADTIYAREIHRK